MLPDSPGALIRGLRKRLGVDVLAVDVLDLTVDNSQVVLISRTSTGRTSPSRSRSSLGLMTPWQN
jgi:hypothetical protein